MTPPPQLEPSVKFGVKLVLSEAILALNSIKNFLAPFGAAKINVQYPDFGRLSTQ